MKKISQIYNDPLVKRMMVYIFSDGLGKAVPFLVMPVLALYLTPAEFGLASNYLIFTQFIGAIISMSTYSYFSVDYYRIDKEERSRVLSNLILLNLLLSFLSSIILLFAGEQLKEWFYITLEWQLLGCLMMFFSSMIDLFIVYLRMEEKARQYGMFQIMRSLLSAALSVLFVIVLALSWQGRVYGLLITNIIVFLIAMYSANRYNMLVFDVRKNILWDSLKFGIPLLPHRLSTWIRGGFERLVITKKVGIADTGVFSFGMNISNAITLFVTSFFNAFTPYVYKQLNAMEKNEKTKNLLRKNIVKKSYLSLGGFVIFLITGFFALSTFVRLFFTGDYLNALNYIPILFIGLFFAFVYNLFSIFVFYSKKTRYLGIVTITVGFIQAACTIPLIDMFGTIGAAYSLVFGSFLKAVFVIVYSIRVYPMPWLIRNS